MTNSDRQSGQSSNSWQDWHRSKEGSVDQDMTMLEEVFKKRGVSRILDLGCGTGRHSIFFAERGFEVFGLDPSADTIKQAQQRIIELDPPPALTIWETAPNLPYENEFFDAVLSIRAFHHAKMEFIKKVVGEISRVIGRGNPVYVQVPMLEKVQNYIRQGGNFEKLEPGTFVPLEGPEKGVPHHNFTKDELLNLFNGFMVETLTIRDEHYNLLATKL